MTKLLFLSTLIIQTLLVSLSYSWERKCSIPGNIGCDTGSGSSGCKFFDPIKSECMVNLEESCTLPYGDFKDLFNINCHCAKSICGEIFCASIPNDNPCYWLNHENDIQECNNDLDCIIASHDGTWNVGSLRSRCVNIDYFKCDCDFDRKRINSKGVCIVTCNFLCADESCTDESCSDESCTGQGFPGSWTSLANTQRNTEGHIGGVLNNGINDIIVIALGTGGSPGTHHYNIDTNVWTNAGVTPPFGPPLTDLSHEGAAVVINNELWTLNHNLVHKYNIMSNTWSSLITTIPGPNLLHGFAAAASQSGTSIYVFGGRLCAGTCCGGGDLSPPGITREYDISGNTWSNIAPLIGATRDIAAVNINDKIYVIGGCENHNTGNPINTSGDLQIYDIVTNTWAMGTPMPTPRGSFYSISSIGSIIYVTGGFDDSGAPGLTVNEAYDIECDKWYTLTQMPTNRAEHVSISHDGFVYVIGGGQPGFGSGAVNVNERFDPCGV